MEKSKKEGSDEGEASPSQLRKERPAASKAEQEKQSVLKGIDATTPMNVYMGDRLHRRLEALSPENAEKVSDNVLLDMHWACYLPEPEINRDHPSETRKKIMESILSMPEAEEVRRLSAGSITVSDAAAIKLAEILIKELENKAENGSQSEREDAKKMLKDIKGEPKEKSQSQNQEGQESKKQKGEGGDQNQNENKQGSGSQGDKGKNGGKEGQNGQGQDGSGGGNGQGAQNGQQCEDKNQNQSGQSGGEESGQMLKNAMQNAMAAAEQHAQNVKNVESAVQAMSRGSRAGSTSGMSAGNNPDRIIELAKDTRINQMLRVLDGMPKLVIRASKKYREDTSGENLGYEEGNDLSRIAPTELLLPDLEFLLRFSQEGLLQYRKGKEKEPAQVYVLLDKSSSMDNQVKLPWSRAVALSLYIKARKEGRDYYMRFFDAAAHELKEMTISARINPLDAIEYIAGVMATDGTKIGNAIEIACEDIAQRRKKWELKKGEKATIYLITDGEDTVDEHRVKAHLDAAGAVLVTVMVEGDNEGLKRVSKHYFTPKELSGKDAVEVVKAG